MNLDPYVALLFLFAMARPVVAIASFVDHGRPSLLCDMDVDGCVFACCLTGVSAGPADRRAPDASAGGH